MNDSLLQMDDSLLGNQSAIDERVAAVEESIREAFRAVLCYLYMDDGPMSIKREFKAPAEAHLSAEEHYVFQWLYKRTDGKLRRLYGAAALDAAKRARFRCERCGFADIRALNLEKGEYDEEAHGHRYHCLCANCHTVQARAKEMDAVANSRKNNAASQQED